MPSVKITQIFKTQPKIIKCSWPHTNIVLIINNIFLHYVQKYI